MKKRTKEGRKREGGKERRGEKRGREKRKPAPRKSSCFSVNQLSGAQVAKLQGKWNSPH